MKDNSPIKIGELIFVGGIHFHRDNAVNDTFRNIGGPLVAIFEKMAMRAIMKLMLTRFIVFTSCGYSCMLPPMEVNKHFCIRAAIPSC